MKNHAATTLDQITKTMLMNGFDFEKAISDFGQVSAYIDRLNGRVFSLRDHVRGLILAQLSNQRPWGPIADNLAQIEDVFFGFDPESLKGADHEVLSTKVKELRCGNRQIGKQCKHLASNIKVLEYIQNTYSTIDTFVTSDQPEKIARKLSEPGSTKLMQMGFTLSMEYLRNVGINVIKPDLHICRIIGPERLGLANRKPSPEEAYRLIMDWAKKTDKPAIWIDNVLWLFAAKDYAAICTSDPKCSICRVNSCRMNSKERR